MVILSKGEKVSLSKAAEGSGVGGGMTRIQCGLGWDIQKYDGASDFDLDASIFMCGANGKVPDEKYFVYFRNLKAPGVEHMGDNKTGVGDGDDEVIRVDLSAVPAEIEKIAFTVTIYDADVRRQNFGMVSNAYIRVLDAVSGTELIKYDLGEDYSVETSIIAGELYRHNGEWKFNALGSGFAGGLAALCKNFGLNV